MKILLISLMAMTLFQVSPVMSMVKNIRMPMIINSVASAPKYPQIVLLYDERNYSICTGTLIGTNTVLTAAHCVVWGLDVYVFYQNKVMRGIGNWIDRNLKSDIALLQLEKPIKSIRPWIIDFEKLNIGDWVFFSGFGNERSVDQMDLDIQHTGVNKISKKKEFEYIVRPQNYSLTEQGDSGGPLFKFKNGQVHVYGVVSSSHKEMKNGLAKEVYFASLHTPKIHQQILDVAISQKLSITGLTNFDDWKSNNWPEWIKKGQTCFSQMLELGARPMWAILSCKGHGKLMSDELLQCFKDNRTEEKDWNNIIKKCDPPQKL